MAIPKYQEYMYPLMNLAADKEEHTVREAYELMAKHFNLSEKDIKELLPSGNQTYLINRIGIGL